LALGGIIPGLAGLRVGHYGGCKGVVAGIELLPVGCVVQKLDYGKFDTHLATPERIAIAIRPPA